MKLHSRSENLSDIDDDWVTIDQQVSNTPALTSSLNFIATSLASITSQTIVPSVPTLFTNTTTSNNNGTCSLKPSTTEFTSELNSTTIIAPSPAPVCGPELERECVVNNNNDNISPVSCFEALIAEEREHNKVLESKFITSEKRAAIAEAKIQQLNLLLQRVLCQNQQYQTQIQHLNALLAVAAQNSNGSSLNVREAVASLLAESQNRNPRQTQPFEVRRQHSFRRVSKQQKQH